MANTMCKATQDPENEVFGTRAPGTLTKAVRDVCDAIRLVKTNMKRFVSRAAEIQL
jgi:hypothetical protein